MTRPNITKFQESEIKRAAKAAYFRYLASKPRPLHPDAPAEDEAANAEYAEENIRLEQAAIGVRQLSTAAKVSRRALISTRWDREL